MKFVTKDEFNKAIATLKLAVENGQVHSGHHDNPAEMTIVQFSSHAGITVCDASYATFVGAKRAALKQLHTLRGLVEIQRIAVHQTNKELEKLQKTEGELSQLIATLKE